MNAIGASVKSIGSGNFNLVIPKSSVFPVVPEKIDSDGCVMLIWNCDKQLLTQSR